MAWHGGVEDRSHGELRCDGTEMVIDRCAGSRVLEKDDSMGARLVVESEVWSTGFETVESCCGGLSLRRAGWNVILVVVHGLCAWKNDLGGYLVS